ncbi:unnamed protein product [Vitrella brassicaformis CCMP3155]|uniref:Uncharacterized protein n=1 Tax=Vitrella brassicaformis (strain CCMP3155) TaxID=1169540 RepID=A0A0G4EDE2_VITBC|nr:unnamed protein product [Vitrella brassicaformis CCMP3155]|eukprot:CEL93369.1 unnamed protein product [Vitrella brassicaformis CCMP3155]
MGRPAGQGEGGAGERGSHGDPGWLGHHAKMWVSEAANLFALGLEGLSVLMGELLHEYMERICEPFLTTEQPHTIHQLSLRVAIENGVSWADRLQNVIPPLAQSILQSMPALLPSSMPSSAKSLPPPPPQEAVTAQTKGGAEQAEHKWETQGVQQRQPA